MTQRSTRLGPPGDPEDPEDPEDRLEKTPVEAPTDSHCAANSLSSSIGSLHSGGLQQVYQPLSQFIETRAREASHREKLESQKNEHRLRRPRHRVFTCLDGLLAGN